jgi:hypothetical protein
MAEFSNHTTMLHHIHVLVIGSLLDAPDFFLFPAKLQQPTPDFSLFPAQTTSVHSSSFPLPKQCAGPAVDTSTCLVSPFHFIVFYFLIYYLRQLSFM